MLIAPIVYSWYISGRHEDELLLLMVGAGDDGPRKLDRQPLSFCPFSSGGACSRNLVNTSVTSVDTSADCASGRGMLASTDTLEELPIVCTPMRGGWW
jgi:hypothetical protein